MQYYQVMTCVEVVHLIVVRHSQARSNVSADQRGVGRENQINKDLFSPLRISFLHLQKEHALFFTKAASKMAQKSNVDDCSMCRASLCC